MSESHPAMQWLRAGVPMSLLLDLADPAGPDTRAIMAEERRAAQDALPAFPRTLAGALSTAPIAVPGIPLESA